MRLKKKNKSKQNQCGRRIHTCFVAPPDSLQLQGGVDLQPRHMSTWTMSARTPTGQLTPLTAVLRHLSQFTACYVKK